MVATMRYLLLFCISIFLIGCDQFPGPNVRSEFPNPVRISITYSDGNTFSHEWPSCRVLGLGAMGVGRFGVKEKEGVSINQIVIESEGKVVHRFDKTTIDAFIEKEKREGGHPIWVIDEAGIRFSKDNECSLEKR